MEKNGQETKLFSVIKKKHCLNKGQATRTEKHILHTIYKYFYIFYSEIHEFTVSAVHIWVWFLFKICFIC